MERIINFQIGGTLQLVESGKLYGNLSADPLYYRDYHNSRVLRTICGVNVYKINTIPTTQIEASVMSKTDIMRNREKFGWGTGFNGKNMFVASQEKGIGYCTEIKQEMVDKARPATYKVDADFIIVTANTPYVAIGAFTNSSPVAMIYDERQRILIATHVSDKLKFKNVPKRLYGTLKDVYESRKQDMCGIITINSENYPVLVDQFKDLDLINYHFSQIDTASDRRYFHSNEGLGFSGAYIDNPDLIKTKLNKLCAGIVTDLTERPHTKSIVYR